MNYATDTSKYEHDRAFLVNKWKELCSCVACHSFEYVVRSSDEYLVRNESFVCKKCTRKDLESIK